MRFFIYAFCVPLFLFSQSGYEKNNHVQIRTQESYNQYSINYKFKDHFGQINSISLVFNKKEIDQAILKMGVPYMLFERYRVTKENERKRSEMIQAGLFMKEDDKIVLDYNAVIQFYQPYCKTISDTLIEILKERGEDSQINRIEIAMKFIQDIPYGVPKKNHKKYKNGCLAPIEVLIKGYGDCDSKTLLFVSILSHMVDPSDIIFVKSKHHVLSAIRYDEKIIGQTDFFRYNQKKYYICETAGPGRFLFGEKSLSRTKYSLYPLLIN